MIVTRWFRHVAAVAAVTTALLWSMKAHADTPNSYGSFMIYGGSTSDTGLGYCIQYNTTSGAIEEEACLDPINNTASWEASGQEFEVKSNTEIHAIVSGTDKGCLDLYGDAITSGKGTLDIDSTCNGTAAQHWQFSNGVLSLTSAHSGYCINVVDGTVGDGTTIDMESCSGGWDQNFLPISFSVKLVSQINTALCLDVYADSQDVGTEIDNGTCNSTHAQFFSFEPEAVANFHATLFSNTSTGAVADTCGFMGGAGLCAVDSCYDQACDPAGGYGNPTTLGDFSAGTDGSEFYEYSLNQTLTTSEDDTANSTWGVLEGASTAAYQVRLEGLNLLNLSSGMQWNMTIRGL